MEKVEEGENKIERIEKRTLKMEEMLTKIWEIVNRMPTVIREEVEKEVQREGRKEKEGKVKISHALVI